MNTFRWGALVLMCLFLFSIPAKAGAVAEVEMFLSDSDNYLEDIPNLNSAYFSTELSNVDVSSMTFVPVIIGTHYADDPTQNTYWYIALEDSSLCIEKRPGDPYFYKVNRNYRPAFLDDLGENGLTQDIHGEMRTIEKFLCVNPDYYGGIYHEKLYLQTDKGDFIRYYHGDSFVDLTAQEEEAYWAAFETYASAYSTTHNFWGMPLNGVPSFVAFARNVDAEKYQLTIFDYYPGWLNIPIFGALAVGLFLLIRRLFPDFGKTWKNMDPPEYPRHQI